jgi:PH (Pleckstrin Homology) domain-containing protein
LNGLRFLCTPGGAVLAGRRRLRLLLVGLALLLIAVACIAFFAGRRWPALFALLVALVPWTAWRMSGDLDLFWIDLYGDELFIQMRRRRLHFSLAGVQARRLTSQEIDHLTRLATTGGVVAGSGGFDSSQLGEFDLYASDLGNAVLLDLGEERLVLTPDEPDEFVAALAGRAPALR